ENTDGTGVFEAAPESQIVDLFFIQIQAQFMKADRHFYGTEEILHRFDPSKGCAFKIRKAGDVKYVGGKLGETLRILFIHITCPASPYRGKPGSVSHVVKSSQFVLELVARPVASACSAAGKSVVGQTACPHNLCPGVIVP